MAVFVQFLTLIRVLFPRWNFFDQLGHQFYLSFKGLNSPNWTLVELKSRRTFVSLFFNPYHNMTLAQISAIELFVQEMQFHKIEQISDLDSFKLIKSLIEIYSPSESFQFQIEAIKDNSKFTLYTSSWLTRTQDERF